MNPDALALIRSFEGFRETPYWDVNALRTGYGSDTITLPDGTVQRVGKDTRVTREDADRDLQRRVQTEFMPIAAKAVGQDVFSRLSSGQQAALTSIAYNYGELPGSVARAVASGDMEGARAAIVALGSHNDGINRDRRAKEAAIFAGGDSDYARGASGGGYGGRDETPMPRTYGDMKPEDRRLAWAYANGKMTPEDEALYEQGAQEGLWPKIQRAAQAAKGESPLNVYAQTALSNSSPLTYTPITTGRRG